MPAETAAEVFDRLASKLISVREEEINQQAVGIVAKRHEAHQLLDSGEALRGLLLEKEAFWDVQELERELKKARSFPVRLHALLEEFGIVNIPLEIGERQVEQTVQQPAAVIVKPTEKKRGPSRWEQVIFEVDGVELKLTLTEKAVIEALIDARSSSGQRPVDLAKTVFPHYPENKMSDAVKHLVVVISNLRHQKLPGTGLNIVHTKAARHGEAGSYSLPVKAGFVPSTDGHQPDMLPLLPSSGVLDLSGAGEDPPTMEDFEIGPLTFSEADRLVLAIALLKNYDSYKDPKTGRLAKFGLNLSAQKAGEIRTIVGEEEVSHNFVPGPAFNRIIQLITKIISTPQMLRRQNPPEMGIIFDLFGGYNQKQSSVQDLDKNLRDLLGSWMQLRRVSR